MCMCVQKYAMTESNGKKIEGANNIPSQAKKFGLQEALLLLGGQGIANDEFHRLRNPNADNRIQFSAVFLSRLLFFFVIATWIVNLARQPHSHTLSAIKQQTENSQFRNQSRFSNSQTFFQNFRENEMKSTYKFKNFTEKTKIDYR